MKLTIEENELNFQQIELIFVSHDLHNIFSNKNNKTLSDTLVHRRYQKFSNEVISNYSDFLDWNLGDFLLHLKSNNDGFDKSFLNKYGDQSYCIFYIDDETVLNKIGLYTFSTHNKLKYIGRCLDSFKKRLNQGYGKIHPKNCYIDGQATNCHLNSLICINRADVSFYVHPMDEEDEIKTKEKVLIRKYSPPWNIAR